MKRALVLPVVMLAIAACGGKPGPTGPTNTQHAKQPAGSAVELWSKTLVKGKKVTLHAVKMGDQQTSNPDIIATVTEVTTANGVTTATVAWTNAEGASFGQLPSTFTVSAVGVKMDDMSFPAALADITLPTGLYVSVRDKRVCYGSGPPPGTTQECADVCDASVCIDDDGFSGGLGTFWPDYWEYSR